jgi:sugar phosphate isomerase/epimerase
MSDAQKPGELTRRDFLRNLAGLGVGGTLLTACAGNSTAASAAGSLLRAPLSQRIGVQLYSVRDLMQQDFEGTIARVAEIGYNDVEFAGYFNRTPEQVRKILDQNNLKAPSSHLGLDLFRNDLKGTLEMAKVIGHEYVTVPSGARGADLAAWRGVAAEFNRFGAAAREAGLKFAYHNHNFEFQGVAGGQTGYDILLNETDPELVFFEQDLYWTTFADRDPIELFNRAPHRFPMWHVKDLTTASGQKAMAPVGKGSIDWKKIFADAQLSGLQYPFVEHDTAAQYPGGSLASIQASYTYLKQLLS